MSHSIRQDGGLYGLGDAASNASALFENASFPSDFSFLQSKVLWGFSLLLAFVVAKAFGSKQKLPAGTKPLPKMAGEFLTILQIATTCADNVVG